MMNVLALGLVLTSLVTAGIFSPTPAKEKPSEAVIVKEGHRVVVVEYEEGDGNTKVSISPKDDGDKVCAHVNNDHEEIQSSSRAATEVVCDAYGKCKRVLASAMGKTREAVAENAHVAADKAYEVKDEAVSKVKDAATDAAHKASDKVRGVKESADRTVEMAKEVIPEKAKQGGEAVRKKVKEMEVNQEKAEEWVEHAKEEGKKEIDEMVGRSRSLVMDVLAYVGSLSGLLHLMGFAVAYGMCVWVTFVSSYVLAGALPKQQFGTVQSRIYPVYFKGMVYSVGAALLGHLMSGGSGQGRVLQGLNLGSALLFTMVNLVWVEPRATRVMFERMKKEKEEGNREKDSGRSRVEIGRNSKDLTGGAEMVGLSGTLQKLNSYSSFLNVLTLMSLTWHLVHLAKFLHY